MKSKTIKTITELTVAEQQAAIKWLEDAALSASDKSEQANQAGNALRVIKFQEYIIKRLGDLSKLKGNVIDEQDEIMRDFFNIIKSQNATTKRLDDSAMARLENVLHVVV